MPDFPPGFKFKKVLPVLLILATCLAYLPSMRGEFLWDDDAYISENTSLTNVQGLKDIWLKPGAVPQYYPMTFTAFWVENRLWGLRPLGYHLVNVLLHSVNALLTGIILSALGMSGAWIAAWLFALHPVMVESVAWMTELKNVLSTFFYLLTLLCLLKNSRAKRPRLWREGLALFLFAAAVLSKSVTVTLPVSFLLISVWLSGSWDPKKMARAVPLFGIGLAAALMTMHVEHRLVRAEGPVWDFTAVQRVLIAGRAFWFYLLKLFYPSPLVFIYPRWTIEPQQVLAYLYPATAAGFVALLAYGRRWWGKIPMACFLFFVLSLSPTLGFSNFYFMRYSFVADHFQYLASLGVFALAGWALSRALTILNLPKAASVLILGLLCVNLALATANQSRKYTDNLRLWEHTLGFNPDSAITHHNLGIELAKRGSGNLAVAHLRTAEALDPSFPQTHLALAYMAVRAERWKDARHQYEEAIRLGISDPQVLRDFAALPTNVKRHAP